jgi:hypothetical protein
VDRYLPGVAEAVIACLGTKAACDPALDPVNCTDLATDKACPSASAKAQCTQVVPACDPNAGGIGSSITQEGCEMFARAMTDAGAAEFFGCLQQKIDSGTCAADNVLCADAIRR